MANDGPPLGQLSLANERTFLAWIRTSLALVVTGVALEAFEVPMPPSLRLASASIFIVLGLAAAAQAWIGWRVTDAAIRGGRPLPAPLVRTALIVGVIAATVIVGIGLVLG